MTEAERTESGTPRTKKSTVGVSVGSVRHALEDRLGIRLESVSGRVDWVKTCEEAAPFQLQAARDAGAELQTFALLHDRVAGVRAAIMNARDWGEYELARAMATAGFGDANAVVAMDLAPFAGPESLALLLMPQVSGGNGDGISLLASALTTRKSGVLMLENFEVAHSSVQGFLLEAVSRGVAQDYSGRPIWMRGFACLSLIKYGLRPPLGFAAHATSGHGSPDVDFAIELQKPAGPFFTQAIVQSVLRDISDELGIKANLDEAAAALVERRLSADRGITGARRELKRLLGRAIAERISKAPQKRLCAVVFGVKDGQLVVVRGRAVLAKE